MLAQAVLVLGRVGLIAWSAVVFLIGLGSLISTPWPFVLAAFSISSLPFVAGIDRHRLLLLAAIAALVTAVPVALLY
jgi:hypothetical protein